MILINVVYLVLYGELINLFVFQPEAVQTLYMRVLHILYRFRPECHSMVSPVSVSTLSFVSFVLPGFDFIKAIIVFMFEFGFCCPGSALGEHPVSSIS